MRGFPKLSSALLLGTLTLASTTHAAIEVSSGPASYDDKIPAIHSSFDKDTLVRSNVSITDLENLQKTVKANVDELETQKRTISDQARQIEELKRSNGSSSSASNSDIADLKRTVKEQERDLDTLARQVEDLKRNSGSSANSNNSEISNLKQQVNDQDRTIDQLKRIVEELSQKVK
ncbi:hypothetical protein C1886_07500 [Pseudomonas sp. FW300-N1A1]|uniref:hypothetical protein n=1 Tax=Pseudomonas sp. FW300-N1A1 TaxID=2075555 RepID=UPI000CD119D9|nr:hypothetical protein [Pseudomonas sp. FW300-N1A1]POA20817.1 hypothetical protein C1886_07500 [Pseudomonas sp. FW300-N1A1]